MIGNMKNIIRAFMFLFPVLLFGQGNYWLQEAGSTAYDEGYDISSDANGNTYTTGYFSGTAKFGSIQLTSSGVTDIFIAKVNSQGVYQWAVKAGGVGPDKGNAIKTDAQGNSYVTGFYYGTATFGTTTISSVNSSQDVFLAKYNSAGILQWVVSAGGSAGDIGNGVNLDNNGNVVITGQFQGSAVFGTTTLTSMINPNSGNPSFDVFTAKYSAANGSFIWAKKGTAKYDDRGMDVACDLSGNIYVIGQFSDTIKFDQTHNNNMNNICFVIKYNSSGNEQWFRCIGGTSQCMGYGIAVDKNSNIYVTGDFNSSLIFFGNPNTTISNTYPNCIFIAKYNSGGDLLWAKSDGSQSEITSRNIALDDSSNAYVVGSFKCRLNQYADVYGQGTFNSVGYLDVFTSKYNSSGVWQWARQAGGKQDDYGYGITIDNTQGVVLTGSFSQNIFFPGTNNFVSTANYYSYQTCNPPYCSDSHYNLFYYLNSAGSTDIFICKGIDPTRQPFDYYYRYSSSCQRPFEGSCISNTYASCNNNCPDTIKSCGTEYLYANTKTLYPVYPDYTYSWSTNQTGYYIQTSTSGTYYLTVTTNDGCFSSSDSIFVKINPSPSKPTITDSKGININSINPTPISLCIPDSVTLTGGNICSGCTYGWSGPGIHINPVKIWPQKSGTFCFSVTDSNGCSSSTCIQVSIDSVLHMPPATSHLVGPDTVKLCKGQSFKVYLIDSLFNSPYPWSAYTRVTKWTFNPSLPAATHDTFAICTPTQTGLYQISTIHTIYLKNKCHTDSLVFYDTINVYVVIYPIPTVSLSISGKLQICPGGTTTVHATTNASGVTWSGPGISGSNTLDSVLITSIGSYSVSASITNSYGCSATASVPFNVTNISPPAIVMNPSNGIICPNDSVTLTCSGSGHFSWYGPSGQIGGNTQSITVNTAGSYFCVLTDPTGCVLSSNTIELNQYSTPYLFPQSGTVMCPGGSMQIQVITAANSIVQWQSPLSGSSLIQTVYAAGTYTCNITTCGILTQASVTITLSNPIAVITPGGPLTICTGDSVVLNGNNGMAEYQWSPGNQMSSSIAVYQSGTYTLTTTDSYGCKAVSAPVTVNVYPINLPVVHDTVVCYGKTVTFNLNTTNTIQWYDAASGGNLIGTGTSFTTPKIVATTTYYFVAYNSICYSVPVPITITVIPGSASPVITSNSPVCKGNDLFLNTDSIPGIAYNWSGPNGFHSTAIDPVITNTTSASAGIYYLSLTSSACHSPSDSVTVQIIDFPPYPFTSSEIKFCTGDAVTLNAAYPGATYLWNDNSTAATLHVTDSCSCWVMVSNGNCKVRDSIKVDLSDCIPKIEMPNVFTPNQDGYNDLFIPIKFENIGKHDLKIFNRWGRLLYESDNAPAGWDGRYNGNRCSDGVYFWIIEYVDLRDNPGTLCGTVTLLR